MKGFLFGLIVGVGATFGAQQYLIGGKVDFNLPASASPTPTPTLPPGVQVQIDAMQRAVAQARTSGNPVPVTLTLNDQQLTASAAAFFPLNYVGTLSDPSVHLKPGQIQIDCAATLAIVKTTATIVAVPQVNAGKLAVKIESATLGGQTLPDAAKQALAADVANSITSNLPASVAVSSVVVGQGTLTLQGMANP